MAQGGRRPARHARQPSRLATLISNRGPRPAEQSSEDDATEKYIRRVLCAKQSIPDGHSGSPMDDRPLEELLPPLTSSNAVDLQLYALIAVILSQFVQTWYNKITPDQDFVREIVLIVAHCSRGLEQRLRGLDVESLLLDDVPALVSSHLDAVEAAARMTRGPGQTGRTRIVFSALRPHPALMPMPTSMAAADDQQENERAWSQTLVNKILPLVLPPEDYLNPGLQVLTSEIFSGMIVHNGLCGKASEPWLIWEGVTKVIYSVRPDLSPPKAESESARIDRLELYGLLTDAESGSQAPRPPLGRRSADAVAQVFWSVVQCIALIWLLLRGSATALMHAKSLPMRSSHGTRKTAPVQNDYALDIDRDLGRLDGGRSNPSQDRPIAAMAVWACLTRLTCLHQSMPWLTGLLSLLQWLSLHGPGQVCGTNSRLDRLLSFHLHERLLDNPYLLPGALRAVRHAVFPGNALAPARPVPSPDQVATIKLECARVVVEVVPPYVRSRYFATHDRDAMVRHVEGMLDLFADQYVNKSLVISAVEMLVAKLFPELV